MLVSKIHKPTLRALAYARVARPDVLEAVTVKVDLEETRALSDGMGPAADPDPAEGAGLALPRDHTARSSSTSGASDGRARATSSRCTSPSTSSAGGGSSLLHNQSALRLKGRLLFTPGVMVTSVPWQLESSDVARRKDDDAAARRRDDDDAAPTAVRRGEVVVTRRTRP